MSQVEAKRARFRPGWRMTAFAALFLPLTVALGTWQLARGAEKERLAEQFFEGQGRLPIAADEGAPGLPSYTRVRLHGQYDPERYFLLDNRTHGGRVGYDVIGLFRADDDHLYLVNRGWVPAPATRDRLPAVTTPAGEVSVTGSIWRDAGLDLSVAGEDWSGRWPERVQHVDPEVLSARAGGGVPVEIRLDPGAPGVLEARYEAPVFAPERHYGYAAQWFGLALVLVILYVHFGLRHARDR